MTRLVLNRAPAPRSSGEWKDEDYDVFADGKLVGRILEEGSAFGPPELRWLWSITEIVPAVPNVTYGHAATLDEAKAKFRDNWTKAMETRVDEPRPVWGASHSQRSTKHSLCLGVCDEYLRNPAPFRNGRALRPGAPGYC
jgi:hypothetical protein